VLAQDLVSDVFDAREHTLLAAAGAAVFRVGWLFGLDLVGVGVSMGLVHTGDEGAFSLLFNRGRKCLRPQSSVSGSQAAPRTIEPVIYYPAGWTLWQVRGEIS